MEKYVIDYLKFFIITYTSLFIRGLELKVKMVMDNIWYWCWL